MPIVPYTPHYFKMKFALAVAALTLSGSAAFVPQSLSSARAALSLDMSAVESSTYTFAKSEEIFAEAQNVSSMHLYIYIYNYILVVCQLVVCDT